eukprot:861564-Rhodomonas_salina.1
MELQILLLRSCLGIEIDKVVRVHLRKHSCLLHSPVIPCRSLLERDPLVQLRSVRAMRGTPVADMVVLGSATAILVQPPMSCHIGGEHEVWKHSVLSSIRVLHFKTHLGYAGKFFQHRSHVVAETL